MKKVKGQRWLLETALYCLDPNLAAPRSNTNQSQMQAHIPIDIVWKTQPSRISNTFLIRYADMSCHCIGSRTEYIYHSGPQLQQYQRPFVKLIRLPTRIITETFLERKPVSKSHEKYKMTVWIKSYIFLPNIHYSNVSKIIQSSLRFFAVVFNITVFE